MSDFAAHRGCRLRVYLYEEHVSSLQRQLRGVTGNFFGWANSCERHRICAANLSHSASSDNASCLEKQCTYSTFTYANTYTFTTDVPIYKRLVSACPLTKDPAAADVFLVPYSFGTMMTLLWGLKAASDHNLRHFRNHLDVSALKQEHRWMMDAAISIPKNLPHFNESTAARHVFLFSVDNDFLNLHLNPLMSRAILVHLGDDALLSRRTDTSYRRKDVTPLINGLVVPYRISQWLPFGFPAPHVTRTRRYLVSMNVNYKKAHVRSLLAIAVRAQAEELAVPKSQVLMSSKMMEPMEASDVQLNSTFCLCPTGDSKGFTARFYTALIHGCIPVRVDGYERNTTAGPVAYPFASLLDWQQMVIDIPLYRANASLVEELLAIPEERRRAMQHYIRSKAHWLVTDFAAHAHHDAAQAVVIELEQRFNVRPAIGTVVAGRQFGRNVSQWAPRTTLLHPLPKVTAPPMT